MAPTTDGSINRGARADTDRERIYRSLKAEIVSGVLDMGERLNERQLAARYGVSKTPVREALGLLQQEGLVELVPRAGYLTSRVTMQDVQEIFVLRQILEGACAEMAATGISEEELRHLEHLCSRYRPGDRESYRLFLHENLEFHATIARASGNRRLAQMITGLLEQMQRLLMLRLDMSSGGDDMLEEHSQITAALRDRNPALARDLMVRSITTARQAVVQSLMDRMANWHV